MLYIYVLHINNPLFHRDHAHGNHLLMFRPSSQSCIDIEAVLIHNPVHLMNNILPVHALSGCDTVSSIFGVGKARLAKIVAKNPRLAKRMEIFLEPNATEEDLYKNGKEILASLFVPPTRKNTNFNDLRPL